MKSVIKIFLIFIVAQPMIIQGKEANTNYYLVYPPINSSEAMVYNVRSLSRFANKYVHEKLSDETKNKTDSSYIVLDVLWTTYQSYITAVVLSHELGHKSRIQRVGGQMNVNLSDILIPGFISGSPVYPTGLSDDQLHLGSLGGFEGNALYSFQFEKSAREFEQVNRHELMPYILSKTFYSFYGYVIKPGRGDDANTFSKDQAGDLVNHTLYIYKKQGNAVTLDPAIPRYIATTVPDDLAKMFNDFKKKSLYNLLDPTLLWAMYKFTARERVVTPPFFQIFKKLKWIYGVQFTPSLLGYDLYLTQYFKYKKFNFSIYTRSGGPLLTKGYGAFFDNIIQTDKIKLGLSFDSWEQESYGIGKAYSLYAQYMLNKTWGLAGKVITKDQGYLIGQDLEKSTSGYFGVTFKN